MNYHASHVGGTLWAVRCSSVYQVIYIRASSALEAVHNAKEWLCRC